MSSETDATVWRVLLDHLWAPIGAVLMYLIKGRLEKVEAKADAALPRQEFDRHVVASTKDRDERRQTELALFDRVDDLRKHVDMKFDALTTIIMSSREK